MPDFPLVVAGGKYRVSRNFWQAFDDGYAAKLWQDYGVFDAAHQRQQCPEQCPLCRKEREG